VARRAGNGEGSIFFSDADGRWHGFVSMGTGTGGASRRHVSAGRRADVVRKMRALEAARDAGVTVLGRQAPTVGDWLEHWLEAVAARRVRESTLRRYRGIVEN
jgi:integrase